MSEMLAFTNEHFPNHCAMEQLLKLSGEKKNRMEKDTRSEVQVNLKNERVRE